MRYTIHQITKFYLSGRGRGVSLLVQPMATDYQEAMDFVPRPIEEPVLRKLGLKIGQHGLLEEDLMAGGYILEDDENQVLPEADLIRPPSPASSGPLSSKYSSKISLPSRTPPSNVLVATATEETPARKKRFRLKQYVHKSFLDFRKVLALQEYKQYCDLETSVIFFSLCKSFVFL